MKRTIKPKSASVLEWEAQHDYCFLCLADTLKRSHGLAGFATHHIQKRGTSFRPYRDNPENLMRLCWLVCHAEVEAWPAARQLALKWLHDQCGHPNLQSFITAWLLVFDPEMKAPNRIIVPEVEAYLPILDPRRAHLPPLPR